MINPLINLCVIHADNRCEFENNETGSGAIFITKAAISCLTHILTFSLLSSQK